jgi:hypothetical protein
MSNNRKTMWAVGALLLLLLVAAVSGPNLLRPRMAANQAIPVSQSQSARMTGQHDQQQQPELSTQAAAPDKKLIQNAELGLMVEDVRAAAEKIRRLTELDHGEIDKLEITETSGGFASATLLVRVPASGLESALAGFKKAAVRVEREQVSTLDVTREFYDNEAHLRNLHAEEQQYLAIMKQAHTVKDTLEVSEKLSDVRDRIERLQTQVQILTHDIEMSVVTIALMQESDAQGFGMRWQALYNAKIAVRGLLAGLGEWMNWVVAIFIKLPLIVLWAITVGGILWVAWRVGRFAWLRLLKPRAEG